MDETPHDEPRRWNALDGKLLALLFLLAIALRVWHLTHTEVAARDSIGFIRIAWQLDQAPASEWPGVFKRAEQHPVYPLSVVAVYKPLRHFSSAPDAYVMQWSAQLASSLAAVLLVLPVYALGRALLGRRAGFGAVLLVQCLPVSGRLMADGLSEPVFLLFASSAMACSVRALRTPRAPVAFGLAGLFGALAYLTRPEGVLIVAATGLILLVSPLVPLWQRSRRDWLAGAVPLAVGFLLLAAPYVATTGRLTVKPSAIIILKNEIADTVDEPQAAVSGPLWAAWKVWDATPSDRIWWGMGALGEELVSGSLYVGWLAALMGLWWQRERTVREPGAWMLLLVAGGVAFALWRVAVVVGYVSDRHTLLILLCGSFWAVEGFAGLGEFVARCVPSLRLRPATLAMIVPVAFALAGLPKTLRPLHEHRAGFRAAGEWLAVNAHPSDEVVDPFCWSHYFAGRLFLEGTSQHRPEGHPKRSFVVIDDRRNPHPRLPTYQQTLERVGEREPVYRWTGRRGGKRAEVCVYEVPR